MLLVENYILGSTLASLRGISGWLDGFLESKDLNTFKIRRPFPTQSTCDYIHE